MKFLKYKFSFLKKKNKHNIYISHKPNLFFLYHLEKQLWEDPSQLKKFFSMIAHNLGFHPIHDHQMWKGVTQADIVAHKVFHTHTHTHTQTHTHTHNTHTQHTHTVKFYQLIICCMKGSRTILRIYKTHKKALLVAFPHLDASKFGNFFSRKIGLKNKQIFFFRRKFLGKYPTDNFFRRKFGLENKHIFFSTKIGLENKQIIFSSKIP